MNIMESRLFEDLNRSMFFKAWLKLYRFGLQDPFMRILLKTGYEPWERVDVSIDNPNNRQNQGIQYHYSYLYEKLLE